MKIWDAKIFIAIGVKFKIFDGLFKYVKYEKITI